MPDLSASIVLAAQDLASPQIKQVGSSLEDLTGSADKSNSAFERIKAGFESGMGFAAGITGFRELKDVLEGLADATVNFNGQLEETTMRLDNLTGSAEATQEVIGRIKDLADSSPFTFSELETANERLLRFNFSADQAADLIKVASDAAAGMGAGAAGVDTITEAFGRMNSRTELTTRGIMSLIAMGVPAYDMLAKGLGITTLQAEDLTKKGLIPSIDAINILSASLESKYPEMAATIGGTFGSLKKTIADTMDFMFAELGKPVFDVLESSAKEWLAWLQSPTVREAVTEFASGLAVAIKTAGDLFLTLKDQVGEVFGSIKSVASDALQFLADRLADAGKAFAPWAAQAGASGKIVDDALTGVSTVVQALQFLIQGNFTAAWKTAGNAVDDFKASIDPIRQVLEDNRTLILGVTLALGTFAVLDTVVPAVIGASAAFTALSAAVAEMGGVMATVELLIGGPLILPLLAVSAVVGTVAAAWITNWGDIQGKTVGAADDMKAAWHNLQDAGGILWGIVRDTFLPAQTSLNHSLSGSPDSADAVAGAAAGSIKGLTTDIRDFTGEVKNALQFVKDGTDALNGFKKGGDDVAIGIHDLIANALAPLVTLFHDLNDWLDAHTFRIKFEIPGFSSITEGLAALSNMPQLIKSASDASAASGAAYTIAGSGADARPSQFSDPQLSAAEALAACGPAALVAFMRASGGKVPTLREAANMAMTPAVGGWNTDQGMVTGVSGEQNLLSAYGLSSTLNSAPTTADIQSGANSGTGAIIDTLGHFFTATGFNASTGKFDVGTSGSDLVGGSSSMTLAEMVNLEGQVTGLLTDIKATSTTTAVNTGAAGAGGAGSKEDLITYARAAADRAGINPDIFQRQIQQESGFDPNVPNHGDPSNPIIGIAQFGAATAKGRGVDPTDPLASLDAAAQYDADLLKKYGGSWEKALSAYNAGEGHVASGAPNSAETKSYLDIILGGATTGSFTSPGGAVNSRATTDGTMPLNAAQIAELAKADAVKKAASGAEGIATLADRVRTDTNWLAESQIKEAAKVGDGGTLDKAAGVATRKVDTGLADKLGSDLTGMTSGDLFEKKQATDDAKARKDALTERIADETVANNISTAADALKYKRGQEDQQIASTRAREDNTILNNEKLAAEALVHTRTLQDTEIQYQQGLQLQATAHARKLEDEKIVADQILAQSATVHARQLQDAQVLANEKLQLEATAHSRVLQDAQVLANEQLTLDATVHARKLQDQQIADGTVLSGAATVHSRTLQDAEVVWQAGRTNDKEADTFAQNMAKATTDAQRASIQQTHQDNLKNIADQAAEAAVQLAHARQLQDAEQKYQDDLKAVALAKSRADADTEQAYKDNLADVALAKSRADADKEQAYKDQLADTALQTSRANADKETVYQQGLAAVALAKSRADADTEQVYKDGLAKTALDHSRALQDVEVQYQIGIAHTALMVKRADEDAARADARTKEDADIAHNIELQAAARKFAKDEKDKQDALDKKLADEAYTRQVDALKAEAVISKQNIADKLVLDKQAAVETAQAERDAKKAAFDETAAAIIAKSKAAVEAAGGDFAPIEAAMSATVAAMDQSFATAHDTSSASLVDLANQAAAALGAGGKVPVAIQTTADALTAGFGKDSPAAQAIEVSDRAVELFAQQFGLSWDVARPLLGDIEQGISTNMGDKGLIPHHIGVSDKAVEDFAQQWGISWNEARPILETESDKIKATFGTDVPSAMKASAQAAGSLNTAIQSIQDKQITVTTNYVTNGRSSADLSGGNSGYAAAGQNFAVASISDPSRGDTSGGASGGDTSNASPFGGNTIGQSGPGGKYNDPSTGQPYTHAAGGVTTGPVHGVFGEAGPEAIVPLGDYMLSHKSQSTAPVIDYDQMAAAFIKALNQNGAFAVSVNDIHSGLLQKGRRGPLGL